MVRHVGVDVSRRIHVFYVILCASCQMMSERCRHVHFIVLGLDLISWVVVWHILVGDRWYNTLPPFMIIVTRCRYSLASYSIVTFCLLVKYLYVISCKYIISW